MDIREQRFVDEYIINGGNAYQAALKAGYAKNTARNSFEWITETLSNSVKKRHLPYKPYLRKAIDEELKKLEDAKIVTKEEAIKRLSSIARQETEQEEIVNVQTGKGYSEATIVKRKANINESLSALDKLMKVYGAYTQNLNVDADMDLNISIDYGDDEGGDDSEP